MLWGLPNGLYMIYDVDVCVYVCVCTPRLFEPHVPNVRITLPRPAATRIHGIAEVASTRTAGSEELYIAMSLGWVGCVGKAYPWEDCGRLLLGVLYSSSRACAVEKKDCRWTTVAITKKTCCVGERESGVRVWRIGCLDDLLTCDLTSILGGRGGREYQHDVYCS